MFDPNDYQNESNERDERDRRARLEAAQDEAEEREAILMAEAYSDNPVTLALAGWLKATRRAA